MMALRLGGRYHMNEIAEALRRGSVESLEDFLNLVASKLGLTEKGLRLLLAENALAGETGLKV